MNSDYYSWFRFYKNGLYSHSIAVHAEQYFSWFRFFTYRTRPGKKLPTELCSSLYMGLSTLRSPHQHAFWAVR